ncbi:hypothetical protein SAMN05216600_101465 [Pseudomonas cuatrocienegasensis]|uniref:Uncharacterized protein n=1 Tax=Pseudomonas cuatrocienegasensis TaxID=543360 RepID=A0ABY1B287_9PSED|nr:hypothetical protein SAMN05216600_101465 [Pseudomonas cuatrocienegasensis]
MKTLISITVLLALSAPALADDSQAHGKGLYPNWLISHDG